MRRYLDSQHAARSVERVERLLSSFSPGFARRGLEVGCGRGAVAVHLVRKYGLWVVATDIDPEALNLAKEQQRHFPDRLSLVQADALSLPFSEEEFDLVLGLNMLHHASDWLKALREMDRVLRPRGLLILTERYSPEIGWRKGRPWLHFHGLSRRLILAELKSLGFDLVKLESQGLFVRRDGLVARKSNKNGARFFPLKI